MIWDNPLKHTVAFFSCLLLILPFSLLATAHTPVC